MNEFLFPNVKDIYLKKKKKKRGYLHQIELQTEPGPKQEHLTRIYTHHRRDTSKKIGQAISAQSYFIA